MARPPVADRRAKKPTELVEHDAGWNASFERIKRVVSGALGEVAVGIEHVGSTSVHGLAAKPIIDVDVIVRPEDVGVAIERLGAIGYVHRGDLGIAGREAFRHPPIGPDGEPMPVQHLYVCPADGEEVRRHLAFRDYLRLHPEARERYETVKREGAKLHADDRNAYQDYKSAVMLEILEKALAEYGVSGSALERLRGICLALPETVESGGVGVPSFKVREKIFAMRHGHQERWSIWCKAPRGVQDVLVQMNEERFFVPPYVGHNGWVGVWLDVELDWDEMADLVEESYRMTAPKRLWTQIVVE